jgi:hypothetical protein
MSFAEFVFSAGFIQKTVKVDQIVKLNRNYPWRKYHQKVAEDTRRHSTEVGHERMPGGAGRPHL